MVDEDDLHVTDGYNDVKSISTIIPHELERVDKEDKEQVPEEDHQWIDKLTGKCSAVERRPSGFSYVT